MITLVFKHYNGWFVGSNFLAIALVPLPPINYFTDRLIKALSTVADL